MSLHNDQPMVTKNLLSIFPSGVERNLHNWEEIRNELIKQWNQFLGQPSFNNFNRKEEVIEKIEGVDFYGTIHKQNTGTDTKQIIVFIQPKKPTKGKRPGAIVPYYHPDDMLGYNLNTHELLAKSPSIQFAKHLVKQGYCVVCSEVFPYNMLKYNSSSNEWIDATKILLGKNPLWTGMGKLIHDARLALDFLLEQDDIDLSRILAIGHSLGGKIVFYLGCLDIRVKAVIGSDFGIGWDFTNWDAPWYFGEKLDKNKDLFHHQLLALCAPRSFLLLGGEYDKVESWQYINAAKEIYQLYGKENSIDFINHASGHQPPKEAVFQAYRWLDKQFSIL